MFLYGIFMIGVFFLHMIIAVIENVVGIVLVIMGTKKTPLKRKEIPEPLGIFIHSLREATRYQFVGTGPFSVRRKDQFVCLASMVSNACRYSLGVLPVAFLNFLVK